jgi:aspartate racemase
VYNTKMAKKPTKKIGVLGGAGPAATANFFQDLVSIAQHSHEAVQDTDFAKVYLYNMPMEGFNETGFSDPEEVKNQLISGVKELESWGADFITLPCNTVHFFTKEMREAISIPLISIIESTVEKLKKDNIKKVGILSSRSTRDLALYESAIEDAGIEVETANNDEQDVLDRIVLQVMAGKQAEAEKHSILQIVNRMKNLGVGGVVLGCTELPLAISTTDSDVPLYNTIRILAEDAVRESYN